jgi:hypothetical protein
VPTVPEAVVVAADDDAVAVAAADDAVAVAADEAPAPPLGVTLDLARLSRESARAC